MCKKWRLLPPGVKTESLPEKWYCSLNKGDKLIMTCDAAEVYYSYLFLFTI